MLRRHHLHGLIAAALLAWPAVVCAAPATAEAPAHAADGEHAPDVLGFSDPGAFFGTALWNLLLFIVLLVVLSKFVWPHILNGLNAREEKIRTELNAAEKSAAEAKALMAEYESKVAEAHAEARKTIDSARADAERVRATLVAETEAEIQKMRDRAKSEIESAKQQAVQDLYAQSATLAVAVAEKILQRQIDANDTQKLVEQSLSELNKLESAG